MTHWERNKKSIELSFKIGKEAEGVQASVLAYAVSQPHYIDRMAVVGLGACLADVRRAYKAAASSDYSQVIRTEEAQRFVGTLEAMSKAAGLPTMTAAHIGQFNICYHMLAYEAHGKQTYKVSDGLAMRMALTELRGLKCEDLRLPHKALYLEIPEFLGFKIMNGMSGWHTVDGIYLAEDCSDAGRGVGTTAEALDGGRSWRVCVMGKENDTPIFDNDDAFVYFTIPLVEGWSLDDALNDVARRVYDNKNLAHEIGPDDPTVTAPRESLEQFLAVFRWTLNVMLYATTPDAEHEFVRDNPEAEAMWRRIQKLPRGKKREDLNARLRGMEQKPRTLLGRSVRVTPALRSMFEHRESGGGGALLVRTLVSGHWRRFACGEGRKERKWQFVEPYWRGPEDANTAQENEHRLS